MEKRRDKKMESQDGEVCLRHNGIECHQRNGKEDEAVKRRDAKMTVQK